jgi:hypothetical protein
MNFTEKIKKSFIKKETLDEDLNEEKLKNIAEESTEKNQDFYKGQDKKTILERLKNTLETYKTLGKNVARIALIVGALNINSPSILKAENKKEEPAKIPTAEETLKLKEEVKETKEGTPWYKGWKLKQVVVEKNEKGEWVFNPWKILLPLQVEKLSKNKYINNFEFKVPQEYSRLFDTGKPLREEDYVKIKNYVQRQIQKQLRDKLKGINVSETTKREFEKAEKTRNFTLNHIEVSGYASPEGPFQKGPATIEPGQIDKENIKLAQIRAKNALEITEENLKELGIQNVDKILGTIKVEELQFTPEEMQELISLSKNWGGATSFEKIFNMIVDYNDNKIQDSKTVESLHKIIASKRVVEIEGELSGEEKTIYTIPIPLLLFLIIPALRRKRKEEKPESATTEPGEITLRPKTTTETETTPEEKIPEREIISKLEDITTTTKQIEQEKVFLAKEKIEEETKIEKIKVEPLPDNPEEDPNFPNKVKIALVDDLYQFFDNEDTIRRGLSYRTLCDEMIKNFDRFESDSQRENYIARELLRLWREHDIKARREVSWSEENIADGLDYENQPNQRLWALAHAKVILRLVKEKMNNPQLDYFDLMGRDIENYISEKTKEKVEDKKESQKEQEIKRLKTAIELAMEGKIAWDN